MNFEIRMTEEVYDTVHVLMNNIKTLNEKKEIGAWCLGDWTFTETQATLLIDRFLIPKQTITGTEVDISPESMIDTIKEIGPEQANRIKGHWHIHPFGNGPTNWSGTDEQKIKEFMDPATNRKIFVFFLSSEDILKARIELVYEVKNTAINLEETERRHIDNVKVFRGTQINTTPYYEALKARIAEKVESKKYPTYGYMGKAGNPDIKYGKNFVQTALATPKKHVPQQVLECYDFVSTNNSLRVNLYDGFDNYCIQSDLATSEFLSWDEREIPTPECTIWIYKTESKAQAKEMKIKFKEIIQKIEEKYLEEVMTEAGIDDETGAMDITQIDRNIVSPDFYHF